MSDKYYATRLTIRDEDDDSTTVDLLHFLSDAQVGMLMMLSERIRESWMPFQFTVDVNRDIDRRTP